MPIDRKETAFEIAERINRVIDDMARMAQSLGIPVSPDDARNVYARCVQSSERKWIGEQHYTVNIEKTMENLAILAPVELVRLTQRTVRDGIELIYKTDTDAGYSVTPSQVQNLHHPDTTIYRRRLAVMVSDHPGISQQKKLHHYRLLHRLDHQTLEQANELHRAVMTLPLREAIPGTATPDVVDDIINILAQSDVTIDRRQAILLHDLASHRPAA